MLMNLLMGLGTMVLCLFLQFFLLLTVPRCYRNLLEQVIIPSIWSSLMVVDGVML